MEWTAADTELLRQQVMADGLIWSVRALAAGVSLLGIGLTICRLSRRARRKGVLAPLVLAGMGALLFIGALVVPTSSEKILRISDFQRLTDLYLTGGGSIEQQASMARLVFAIPEEMRVRELAVQRMLQIGTEEDFEGLVNEWMRPVHSYHGRDNLETLIRDCAPRSLSPIVDLMPSMPGDILGKAHRMLEWITHIDVPYPEPEPKTSAEVMSLVDLWRTELGLPERPSNTERPQR